MRKIAYIVNTLEFFESHRRPLALAALKQGYDVHVVTNLNSSEKEFLTDFKYHHVGFSRSGQNPLYETLVFLRILVILFKVKPDLLHLVTIKPVLYGGLAARLVKIRAVVAAISGLGSVFSASKGLPLLRLKLVKFMYALALQHKNLIVIFQNDDDKRKLLSTGAICKENTCLIPGSGVSLEDYSFIPESDDMIIVSMAARLLKEKGVCEFVSAARILKKRGMQVNMQIIGAPDLGNPSSITQKEMLEWQEEGEVSFLGYRDDIASLYSKSNIICLPSYYGEGLPKALIEAAACGRAVITTDMPGCRDAIIPEVTGVLIPAKDGVALADAIELLANDCVKRKKMGTAGRKLAEKTFDIKRVVEAHMDIYRKLITCD